MRFCNQCNNSGFCAWCEGSGKEASASVCRNCYGSGFCLSCGNMKRKQPNGNVRDDGIQKRIIRSLPGDRVNGFEDIYYILSKELCDS